MRFIARLGLVLAIAGAVGLVLSPIGYRLGWFPIPFALLTLLKWATIVTLAAAVLCLIVAVTSANSRGIAIVGLIISVAFGALPLMNIIKARSVPMIHDITTNTDDPPAFVALESVRAASPNGAEYGGPEVAAKQNAAYPKVITYESSRSPEELFGAAERLANEAGWEIAAADMRQGRIEATDTTAIYGFKDDIVIRITATDGGSQLDIRSMSRVGLSDVGKNAARIGSFLASLSASEP
jgi:hypothetical protein